MRLYDTHAHAQFNAFKDDADAVIRRALDAGVMLNLVGTQIDTSKRAVEYAEKHGEGVYAIVGLHPTHLFSTYVDEDEIQFTPLEVSPALARPKGLQGGLPLTGFKSREEEFDATVYRELAKSKKVVGIGECGLEYYRIDQYGKPPEVIKEKQKEVFRQHLALAHELNLPLSIHCRDGSTLRQAQGITTSAYDDLYDVLVSWKSQPHPNPLLTGEGKNPTPLLGGEGEGEVVRRELLQGVMHCYIGTWEQAQKFLDLGLYISFSGIVTFKGAKDLQNVARQVPLDRLLIETDCPYLTPEPHRGERNEPEYVEFVAKKIAELKNISFDEVARVTTENAKQIFKV